MFSSASASVKKLSDDVESDVGDVLKGAKGILDGVETAALSIGKIGKELIGFPLHWAFRAVHAIDHAALSLIPNDIKTEVVKDVVACGHYMKIFDVNKHDRFACNDFSYGEMPTTISDVVDLTPEFKRATIDCVVPKKTKTDYAIFLPQHMFAEKFALTFSSKNSECCSVSVDGVYISTLKTPVVHRENTPNGKAIFTVISPLDSDGTPTSSYDPSAGSLTKNRANHVSLTQKESVNFVHAMSTLTHLDALYVFLICY